MFPFYFLYILLFAAASAISYGSNIEGHFGRLTNELEVADGASCTMRLKVSDVRAPEIVGGPVDGVANDIYFSLVSVGNQFSPMCERAEAAKRITMNAASEQIGDVELNVGDTLLAHVTYREKMPGKMLYDEYHHEVIMQREGDDKPIVYGGMGFLP